MHVRIRGALAIAVTGALAVAGTAAVAGGAKQVHGWLNGYEEVPAVSTAAGGTFQASVSPSRDGLAYKLTYSGLEGDVQQAHIHFGQRAVNGAISVFLCSNLGNGPPGTQACPAPPATVHGTIRAADVIGPAAQGIAPGELEELVRAIKAGATYANVHSSKFPGGEIRSKLHVSGRGDHGDE